MNKTICAISTPLAQSAVGIVRISGENCIEILKKCFVPKHAEVHNMEHSKMYLGEFFVDEYLRDVCLAVIFYAPNSYTGENLAEIHCHGSTAILQGILKTLISNGASLAQKGEFSKRAFLNGKMDLSEAEGICDLIFAENEAFARASGELARGVLFNKIDQMQSALLDILSEFEVMLDYPEEDIEVTSQREFFNKISKIKTELNNLIKSYDKGKKFKNGIRVAICGKPNVGKSTLFNALLGFERAIVTEIAGTTRDTLEAEFCYKGISFVLVDTAGIRNSQDKIELIGVEKTKEQINSCDIVLNLIFAERDEEIIKLLQGKNHINICSKSDLLTKKDDNNFYFSAKTGENISELCELIYEKTIGQKIENDFVICNLRHFDALLKSEACADALLENFYEKHFDIMALEIRNLWQSLGIVTGKTASEEIIDNIFAKFCLGK